MPNGKPAFVRCLQLSPHNQCRIFGSPDRPAVCSSLAPSPDMCGDSDSQALVILTGLELSTRPLL